MINNNNKFHIDVSYYVWNWFHQFELIFNNGTQTYRLFTIGGYTLFIFTSQRLSDF